VTHIQTCAETKNHKTHTFTPKTHATPLPDKHTHIDVPMLQYVNAG